MRFTCDRSALVDKLSVLARGVSTRCALPVLSGILLQVREDRLEMYSTDMELSMRASLAWSHQLLTPTDQVLFRRLGIFPGSFSLDAAEAAGGDEHSDDDEHGHAHEPHQPAVTVPGAGSRGLGCGCLGRLRELCVVVGR